MKGITIVIFLMLSMSYYVHAEEISNKELSRIVNGFLCSDDVQKMSDMVEYPVFFIKAENIFDEYEFTKGIRKAQREVGIYKLGKKCNGFQWSITVSMLGEHSGYMVFVVSSINRNVEAQVFINENGKIVGIIGN